MGELVKLDLIEGHRIETGFYAGLHGSSMFTVAQNLLSTTTPQQWHPTCRQNTAVAWEHPQWPRCSRV